MEEELVLIYIAESYMDYLWISSILEESNIRFLTQHPPLQQVYGYKIIDSFSEPIKIFVFEKDVEAAFRIIAEAKEHTRDYGTE